LSLGFSTTDANRPRTTQRISLVSLPFGPKNLPSLGLSLLKPILERAGFEVSIRYGTIGFARRLGAEAYERISNADSDLLLGDWVFAELLREQPEAERAAYVAALHARRLGRELAAMAERARRLAVGFIEAEVEAILAGDPAVVAFTSTFAQNAASLGAARLLKARRPDIGIVFGGANCEGEMGLELIRRFPYIDAVVSGEGETVAPELFARIARGQRAVGLKGVYTVGEAATRQPETAERVEHLDDLPIPDYRDFTTPALRAGECGLEPHLLVEASRGCWWGEKRHCTFCGLNGSALTFRSKSPQRFVDEVLALAREYRTTGFSAVDNILDHRYFKTALPALAESGAGINLFFEVKANLKREQVELLHRSGVRAIQAGIENLDSGVLALMRKGVTGIQNVQLLRLCKEYGIRVTWNYLFGFPGEDPDAYRRMAARLPLLSHLRPPDVAVRIRLDRFSPFFEEREPLGVTNVRPMPAYAHVYGGTRESLQRLAYYFEFDYCDGRDVTAYAAEFCAAVAAWQRDHDASDLALLDGGDDLVLVDRRPNAPRSLTLLSGCERAVYLACDQIQTIEGAVRAVAAEFPEVAADEVAGVCGRLIDQGLIYAEGQRMLALGVDVSRGGVSRSLREHLTAAAPALV